ncbi:uncharacterized protein LOC127248871 [Andrographis paniculata]|uniref:uncharacterized protein LOC127248871 n=1 Tax=Andrographis paniculata TaxID=175694 RepID=UPI0021E789A1|nr:uncharacterized protein LOC127248871 [Andrographis paniculata]
MDVEMHLESMDLGETIVRGNNATNQSRAKAMIFLRHHINEGLKMEYLTVKNPHDWWNKLKERYDHLKLIVLPKARSNWHNLRLQDFKSVTKYNSAMFMITSQLNLCGENITDGDMMEKTFSIFHASNVILQQQYRERGFGTYSDLIVPAHPLKRMRYNLLIQAAETTKAGEMAEAKDMTVPSLVEIMAKDHISP